LLLLDEHTAALDPKTAEKVLDLTQKIVDRDHLTTLMITHNMRDALRFGNRLIMMHNGNILVDVSGDKKKTLTVRDLLDMFEKAAGDELNSDSLLLS
jgi:putative ABC transport system ATP-binding protein